MRSICLEKEVKTAKKRSSRACGFGAAPRQGGELNSNTHFHTRSVRASPNYCEWFCHFPLYPFYCDRVPWDGQVKITQVCGITVRAHLLPFKHHKNIAGLFSTPFSPPQVQAHRCRRILGLPGCGRKVSGFKGEKQHDTRRGGVLQLAAD